MRINIEYFTSTGNTLWLALEAGRLLEERGHEVRLYEAIKDGLTSGEECDLIGVFYPVWGSDLPDPLRDLVHELPEGCGKRMFLLGTCAAFTGDTGMFWKRIVEAKGYDCFYVDHVLMPSNVGIPGFNFWPPPKPQKRDRMLESARERLVEIVDAILGEQSKTDGTGWLDRLGGGMQRRFYGAVDLKKRQFVVDGERCSRCGLCRRMCPTANIALAEDGSVRFGSACIFCLKCYNLCPENAVLIGPSSRNDKRFRRYKGPNPVKIKPVLYR
jgi:NAD-dependent dihydropyrimidine dehydrogenase PreA subunit